VRSMPHTELDYVLYVLEQHWPVQYARPQRMVETNAMNRPTF
jgi:hypothetical protein